MLLLTAHLFVGRASHVCQSREQVYNGGQKSGTGLDLLSLTKLLVEKHGGVMSVTTEEGAAAHSSFYADALHFAATAP